MASLMRLLYLSFLLCVLVSVKADNLEIGTTVNGQLAHAEVIQLSAIPLKIRTRGFNYDSDVPIKGLSVIDLNDSKASASVKRGGVGATFVNLKLKSERGEPLNYRIQIFV